MNFGYFIQHTSTLRKSYWYFLIPTSGPASGSRRCCKMQSWGPCIHSFEAFNMNLGYFVQHTSPVKNIIGIFSSKPQGQLQGQKGVVIWSPAAVASTVFKLLMWILGILFWVFCWHCLISPSGPASSWRRCYMQSWGPSMHSFEPFKVNIWYFV